MDEDMHSTSQPIRKDRLALRHKKRKDTNVTSVLRRNDKISRYEPAEPRFSELPGEMALEIFSRLPAESVFGCKAVCKSWLSLSSEALHLNKHLPRTVRGLFYNSHNTGVEFVKLSSGTEEVGGDANFSAAQRLQVLKAYDDRIEVHSVNFASASHKVEVDGNFSAAPCLEGLELVDYCNGLLLLESSASLGNDLYVFNPVTLTLFSLGVFTDLLPCSRSCVLFSLVFDPQVASLFRLVCLVGWEEEEVVTHNRIVVFSFERGKCIERKECISDLVVDYGPRSAFLDGKVHRMARGGKILSVDPNNCSYEVMRGPDLDGTIVIELGHSQGLLHCLSYDIYNDILFIWVLESYAQQKWTMKYQLNLHQIYSVRKRHLNTCAIFGDLVKHKVAFHPHKEILFLPLGASAGFLSFDLTSGKRELVVCNSSGNKFSGCWVDMPCFSV